MGEVGIAVPSRFELSFQNPAFLPLNSLTIFQVGLEMDRRSLKNDEQSTEEIAAGLRYLNFSFPVISEKWTTSFGITPYTTTNYKSFSVDSLNNNQTTVLTNFTGRGGITSLSWANGFKLTKQLFVGIRASYLFGAIENKTRTFITDAFSSNDVVDFNDESSYFGLGLELSAGYRKQLNDKKVLNFGAIYELSGDLKGRESRLFETLNSSGLVISTRFISENERTSFTKPSSIGVGVSYQVYNKYTIGLDITSTNWEQTKNRDSFINTTKIGIGGRWTPEYNHVSNYLKRIVYRMGVSFGNMPYEINGQKIREFGINFGASLPVGVSSFDLAFKYGGLGTTENSLIRETYFRIVIGATINDRWFIKRRYN